MSGGPGRACRSGRDGLTHGFGIVGCGVIATTHAEAIGAIGGARLVAVTDPDAVRAAAFARSRGCAAESDLEIKDALAETGEVVLAGEGDGEVRETLAALRDSAFEGYLSLEPHLAEAGRFGGFSGPAGFRRAAQALRTLLAELQVRWR